MIRYTLLASAALLAQAAPTSPTPSHALLLLPASSTSRTSLPPCAAYQATVGARQQTHVYSLSPDCRSQLDSSVSAFQDDEVGRVVEFDWVNHAFDDAEATTQSTGSEYGELSTLLWLHPVSLDVQLPFSPDSSPSSLQLPFLATDGTSAPVPSLEPKTVAVLPGYKEGYLVALSSSSPTLALRQLEYLTSLPSYALYTLVSIPLRSSASVALVEGFPEVPKFAVDRVKKHLENLKFSPAISRIAAGLEEKRSVGRLRDDVRVLSGEGQEGLRSDEKWVSRHSMSEGAPKAAAWLSQQMSSYSFTCHSHVFLPNLTPMLECIYDNSGLGDAVGLREGYQKDEASAKEYIAATTKREFTANETIILSAHYDSRGSFGYPTSPGADDDASGTALVLAVARQISHSSLRFSRKVVFCLFAGEEQGLLGSAWYAKRLAEKKPEREDVAFMLQVDMVGYRKEGEPMQLARPDIIGLAEAGYLVGNLSEIYAPELVTGYTPACCSDHQSFVTSSYPSSWIFERNGAIGDPCYHNSCDLADRPGYSYEQITAHAKVALSLVLETAGFAYL